MSEITNENNNPAPAPVETQTQTEQKTETPSAEIQQDNAPKAEPKVEEPKQEGQTEQKSAFDELYSDEPKQEQSTEEQQVEAPVEYSLTTADGNAFEGEGAEGFKALFKDANLNQKQAQAMFSAYEKEMKEMHENQKSQFEKLKASWVEEVKADRELGGQNFDTTKLNIGRVMEKYGNAELKDYLNKTGIGLHPSFVRFINKVGAAIGNDTNFVNGKGGAPAQRSDEEKLRAMYPNSPDLFRQR